jgi:hypothetical protein
MLFCVVEMSNSIRKMSELSAALKIRAAVDKINTFAPIGFGITLEHKFHNKHLIGTYKYPKLGFFFL